MTEMISYLSNYREETPAWIGSYLRGEQITFKDIMSSRVGYYPRYFIRGNCDGTLIKVGNKSHSVHSFLYVDLIKREVLEKQIAKENSFRGYHPIGRIEWQESDIIPSAPQRLYKYIPNNQETPYCFSMIMERDEDKDDTWGAEHFVVTFLFGYFSYTYCSLFKREYSKAPWLFLLNEWYIRNNYTERTIRSRYGYPQFVIFAKKASIWEGYEKVENVSPVFGELMGKMHDLYRYSNAL